jgi:Domain of unknown function (DUF4432)
MPNVFGQCYSRAELLRRVGHIFQIGGVQFLSAEDGPARGVRLLEFRTGSGLIFKVAIERGMDVTYCEYRGASLAWIPPTLLPGPWYFEQQTEFGWLRTGLGGFCNSCGMVHVGNPETDSVAHYNFPARAVERYGVHDRMALLPGQLLRYGERWEGDECIIEAEGRVVQAQTYGENLVLTRRYTARLGESRFCMHDEVENAGFLPTVHMLLYHINVGFPIVDEGSELVAPIAGPPGVPSGLPTDKNETAQPGEYTRFVAPQKDWLLQGFELRMSAGSDGRVPVAIVNPKFGKGGLAVYVIYDSRQLPKYLEWRMMGEGQYAVGIEPCTNSFGREQVRQVGEMIVLQPGERRLYDLEVGVLDGARQIQAFRDRVESLRTGRTQQ